MNSSKVLQLNFDFNLAPETKQKSESKSNKKQESNFVFDIMDCFKSPVIVFKSAWQSAVPSDLIKNISISRMISLKKGEKMASITEVVAYMMPRTFESPMQHEWVNIYLWAGFQYAKSFKGKEQQDATAEIAPKELTNYEQQLLNGLRIWIYNKRRKELKISTRNIKKEQIKKTTIEQEELFNA